MKKVLKYFLYVCFSPSGRINRAWFWLYVLLVAVLRVWLVGVMSKGDPILATLNYMFVDVVLIYPGIVVGIKRFHDTNRSGWHLLLGLISAGLYIIIVCGFFKGTAGKNKYGVPSFLIDRDSFNNDTSKKDDSNERHKTA